MDIKRRAPSGKSTAGAILVGSFGLLLFLIGGGTLYLNYLYKTEGREVIAIVIKNSHTYDSHHQYSTVEYQFTLPDRRSFTGKQTGYSLPLGETIPVIYLGSHPSFNRVSGSELPEQKTVMPVAGAGVLFLLIGLQSFFASSRKADREDSSDQVLSSSAKSAN